MPLLPRPLQARVPRKSMHHLRHCSGRWHWHGLGGHGLKDRIIPRRFRTKSHVVNNFSKEKKSFGGVFQSFFFSSNMRRVSFLECGGACKSQSRNGCKAAVPRQDSPQTNGHPQRVVAPTRRDTTQIFFSSFNTPHAGPCQMWGQLFLLSPLFSFFPTPSQSLFLFHHICHSST